MTGTERPDGPPADGLGGWDEALADRDPEIPRLLDVLAPSRAMACLHDRFPTDAIIPADPRVVYLRYKPGVSLTACLAVSGPEPLVMLQAVAATHRAKVEKLLTKRHCGPAGWGAVSDEERQLVVVAPGSDRLLPGLARHTSKTRSVDSSRLGDLDPIRYKPHRRWLGVGNIDGRRSVARVVPPGFARTRAPTYAHLRQFGVLAPFSQDLKRGVTVHDWIDGEPLTGRTARPTILREVGRSIARLHLLAPGPLSHAPDHRALLLEAADAIGVLCPEQHDATRLLAARVYDLLPVGGPRVASHGDFSDDQVIIDPQGSAQLIDLDRACLDHAAFDLGSYLAQQLLDNLDDGDMPRSHGIGLQPLLDGYQSLHRPPDDRDILACTLAALLRRAVEPFRQHHPEWPSRIARRIDLVEYLLGGAFNQQGQPSDPSTNRTPRHARLQ